MRAASIALSERFIAEVEARCPQLTLATPRDPARRGSQVSLRFEHGYVAEAFFVPPGSGNISQQNFVARVVTPAIMLYIRGRTSENIDGDVGGRDQCLYQ